MIRATILAAAALLLAPVVATAAAEWSTTYGRMSLPDQPEPGAVRWDYSSDEGRIIGDLMRAKCPGCGMMLDGIWVEAGSAEECGEAQDGSLHWGRVNLQFDPEFTHFSGEWDYCGSGGTHGWTGSAGRGAGHETGETR